MELTSLPKLKELGLVGQLLGDVYEAAASATSSPNVYSVLVSGFRRVYRLGLQPCQRPLLEAFNPECEATKRFFEQLGEAHGEYLTIASIVQILAKPDEVENLSGLCANAVTERFNLPYSIMKGIEMAYIPNWRRHKGTPGNSDDIGEGEQQHTQTLHAASVRYGKALAYLGLVFEKVPDLWWSRPARLDQEKADDTAKK